MSGVVVLAFVGIFVLVMISVSLGLKFYETRRKKHVTEVLQTVAGTTVVATTKLLKDLDANNQSGVERLLETADVRKRAASLLQQAGLDWTPPKLLGTMALAALPGCVAGMLMPDIVGRGVNCLVMMALFGMVPLLYVQRKRAKRLAEMEEQLPDALDFLARSMRAGHAFTISLEMVGGELPEPLGQEFRTLFNEQNLGAPIDVALHNFADRVPLLDVRFFASSVLLQRQTGGNLAEILSRLAYLIRERFRLKGQVKAASSHGRMTAGVLTGMPLITVVALLFISPGYLQGMAKDPDGKWLIGGCIAGQLLGRYFIKRIVNIKV
jgi:tight adherence protein B